MLTRRQLLWTTLTTAAFRNNTLEVVANLVGRMDRHPETSAQDEEFWMQIQEAFELDRNVVNFNNGGCSPAPRIVEDALRRQLDFSNQAPSLYMWQNLEPEVEGVRRRLAAAFGVDAEEIAITRNASESLETCLYGLPVSSGEEILTSDLDYPRMITTIQQRGRREGVKLVQVTVPSVPKSRSEIVTAFEQGLTPKTRMILVSQVVFMNGQINPVREICELGARHGIPVVVDGAHAFAQFPFEQRDLHCDYFGTSLHKWLMAPIGTGFLYVKKSKIADLWSLMASGADQTGNIRKYEEIGTHPADNHNAIGGGPDFQRTDRLRSKGSAAEIPPQALDRPPGRASERPIPHEPGAGTLVRHYDGRDRRHQARGSWGLADEEPFYLCGGNRGAHVPGYPGYAERLYDGAGDRPLCRCHGPRR